MINYFNNILPHFHQSCISCCSMSFIWCSKVLMSFFLRPVCSSSSNLKLPDVIFVDTEWPFFCESFSRTIGFRMTNFMTYSKTSFIGRIGSCSLIWREKSLCRHLVLSSSNRCLATLGLSSSADSYGSTFVKISLMELRAC